MQIERVESREMADNHEETKKIPPLKAVITIRGVIASALIGVLFSSILMKLSLTTGFIPDLNVAAALLASVFIKTWIKLLQKADFVTTPLTRQEATVIHTCAVACYYISAGGGLGSFLLALSKSVDREENVSYKEPRLNWIIAFLVGVSFLGLSTLVSEAMSYSNSPCRRGIATAVVINGIHTTKGIKKAKKQVQGFIKFSMLSFVWSFFQWFYSGSGDIGAHCGFNNFPTLGLKAWKQTFYFDFNMTYVGAGMICSHLVNLSLLFGAVLSWGVMWPLIGEKKGDWFQNDYKVFITISLILGDGFYNLLKTLFLTIRSINRSASINKNLMADDKNQSQSIKKSNPTWVAFLANFFFGVVFLVVMGLIFRRLKRYYLVIYLLLPLLCEFCAYGECLTGMNMASNCGKVALFVIAALAGNDNGVVGGLIGYGLVKSIGSIYSNMINNFKTGQLTHTSPRSMLISQGIGTAIGCIVAPLSFFLFYKAYDVGNPEGDYKAPYALIYRNMAILGVEGFSSLPHHCLQLCYGFFAFAVLANLLRDMLPEKLGKWVPLPMVMAVPFLVGANFAIDMCIGSLVVYIWHKMVGRKAGLMIPAVASGLICGDGLWILPSSVLALAKINPPICMSFKHS